MEGDAELASVRWALDRMVELRQGGEAARFRVVWAYQGDRRVYRLEIRRANGFIERPVWPLPIGTKNTVEESTPAELDLATSLVKAAAGVMAGEPADAVVDTEALHDAAEPEP